MTITISSEDPRSIKAIVIAAGARQWLRCRTVEGEVAWGIPSQCQPGRYYVVTAEQCDCVDFKRFGLSRGRVGEAGFHGACKHVRAVQLRDELARAQETPEQRRHLRPLRRMSDGDVARIFGRL